MRLVWGLASCAKSSRLEIVVFRVIIVHIKLILVWWCKIIKKAVNGKGNAGKCFLWIMKNGSV